MSAITNGTIKWAWRINRKYQECGDDWKGTYGDRIISWSTAKANGSNTRIIFYGSRKIFAPVNFHWFANKDRTAYIARDKVFREELIIQEMRSVALWLCNR